MTETHTPLPCPFCGGEASIIARRARIPFVECAPCGIEQSGATEAEALTAWNTRADSHHRLVEALREATQIATYLWRKHYRDDAPDWRPLPDLRGVISQIDNMVTGLIKEPTR